MKASIIRMNMKSIKTKLLDVMRKYHSDVKRVASDLSTSLSLFEALQKVRKLINEQMKYEIQEDRESTLFDIDTYLQASAIYRDILTDIFNSMAEPPETQLDYTVHLPYIYLRALDDMRPSADAIGKAVRDFAEKGYISPSTEKELQYWAEQGDELTDYILKNYNFSIDKGYRDILNELLNILKLAYISVENREDLTGYHPVDVIKTLYQQGDIDALPALRSWLNSQLFNDYYPVVGITIRDILSVNPESVHLIVWYSQGIQYKGRKTNFITVDSFSPSDMRLGETLEQIQDMYEQGYDFNDIVEELYPDRTYGEVLNILVYVKRAK